MTRAKQIAVDLGVDEASISRWRKRGMPCTVEEARSWVALNVRRRRRRDGSLPPVTPAAAAEPEARGELPAKSWRERHDRAVAKLRELELQEREGHLLDLGRARFEFGGAWAAAVQSIDTIPARWAHLLVGLTDEEAHRTLTGLVYELRMDIAQTWETRAREGLMDEALKAMVPGRRR